MLFSMEKKMKLSTKIKRLFPKTNLGKMIWASGALIEILGFSLLFNSQRTLEFLSSNSSLVSLGLILIGLFVAVSGRRIKK